jgi:hypothetical protein
VRVVPVALVACLALALAGCQSKYRDRLVGKWEAGHQRGLVFHFSENGSVTVSHGQLALASGAWSLDARDNLRIETRKPVQGKTNFTSRISINGDELTMHDPNGTVTTWHRKK